MEHRDQGQDKPGREWIEAMKISMAGMKKAPATSEVTGAGLDEELAGNPMSKKARSVNWVPYLIKEQRDAFWTMTAEQTGVYIRLFHAAADGIPIPATDTIEAAKRLQLNPRLYRRVLSALVARGAADCTSGFVTVPLGAAARHSAATYERGSVPQSQPQSTAIAMPLHSESTASEVESNGNLLPVGGKIPEQDQRKSPVLYCPVVSSSVSQEEDTDIGMGYAHTRDDETDTEWFEPVHPIDYDDAI